MESSTKKLAEHFLMGAQIYGSMLTDEQKKALRKKQAQFLVDNQKAEDELDAMIAEGERLDALAEKAKK